MIKKTLSILLLSLLFSAPAYAIDNAVALGQGKYLTESKDTIYLNGKDIIHDDSLIGIKDGIIVLRSGAYQLVNNELKAIDKEMPYVSSGYSEPLINLPCGIDGVIDMTLDNNDNIWILTANMIMKYDVTYNKLDVKYSLDTRYNNISVADEDTIIVWNTDSDNYWTNSKIRLDSTNKGWYKSEGKWRYNNSTDDFVEYNNSVYYIGSDGYMVTGWFKRNNLWYYADQHGVLTTLDGYKWSGLTLFEGWAYENNKWVYFKEGKQI